MVHPAVKADTQTKPPGEKNSRLNSMHPALCQWSPPEICEVVNMLLPVASLYGNREKYAEIKVQINTTYSNLLKSDKELL